MGETDSLVSADKTAREKLSGDARADDEKVVREICFHRSWI